MNTDLVPVIGGALNLTAALLGLVTSVLDRRRDRQTRLKGQSRPDENAGAQRPP
jgi:hypothetical protein